eukprot:9745-Prymnesium_polylepis.1
MGHRAFPRACWYSRSTAAVRGVNSLAYPAHARDNPAACTGVKLLDRFRLLRHGVQRRLWQRGGGHRAPGHHRSVLVPVLLRLHLCATPHRAA